MNRTSLLAICRLTLRLHAHPQPATAATLAPIENLGTDNIPPVPKTVAEAVGRYSEFRSAGLQSWHPTRREMLVGTRFADTRQRHLVRMPMGMRRQLTSFTDSVGGARFPRAGDADYYPFGKDVGGNEFNQLPRLDLATGEVTMLTDGKSRNSGGPFARKGDRVVYTSSRRNRRDADFYVVNPRDPKSDKLLSQSDAPGWAPFDWSPDDSQIVIGRYISANESQLFLMNASTGERTRLTPDTGEKVSWDRRVFPAAGKSVYTA